MNTALQTFQFDGIPVSVADQNGEGWMIGEDIGKALDYSTPRESINKIFERNQEDLKEYSVEVKMTSTDGKKYDIRAYNEEGVMMIGFFSKQPKAVAFRKWAVQILKAYRHKELPHEAGFDPAYQTLQTKYIGLLEEKLAFLASEKPVKRRAFRKDEIKAVLRSRQEGYSNRDIADLLHRDKGSIGGLRARLAKGAGHAY